MVIVRLNLLCGHLVLQMFSCYTTMGMVSRSAFAGDGHTGALSNGLVVLGPDELGGFADLTGLQ